MDEPNRSSSAERLFPFVLRSRTLLVGREVLKRSRPKLHFVLITSDLTENSREKILAQFAPYPIVQHYTSEDLDRFFGIKGAKVIGFQKSSLAASIYAELKAHRINQPLHPAKPDAAVAASSPAPAVTNPAGEATREPVRRPAGSSRPYRSSKPRPSFSRRPDSRPPYGSKRSTPKHSGR